MGIPRLQNETIEYMQQTHIEGLCYIKGQSADSVGVPPSIS